MKRWVKSTKRSLNYIEHILVLASTVTGNASVSAFFFL